MFVECKNPTAVAKRFFFLAYEASKVFGMGILQKREGVSEEDVFQNVLKSGDYPSSHGNSTQNPHADYVFGRMMKVGCTISENGIEIKDTPIDPEYQSWATTYKSKKELLLKAIQEVEG